MKVSIMQHEENLRKMLEDYEICRDRIQEVIKSLISEDDKNWERVRFYNRQLHTAHKEHLGAFDANKYLMEDTKDERNSQ